jgi:dTDP-4-amino-4,6-dideoxygalactose transaminase
MNAIQHIADTYNLRVIYDGAHAFGVREGSDGQSVARHGDLTMLSFHATKVFNTRSKGAPSSARTQRPSAALTN